MKNLKEYIAFCDTEDEEQGMPAPPFAVFGSGAYVQISSCFGISPICAEKICEELNELLLQTKGELKWKK